MATEFSVTIFLDEGSSYWLQPETMSSLSLLKTLHRLRSINCPGIPGFGGMTFSFWMKHFSASLNAVSQERDTFAICLSMFVDGRKVMA